MTIECEKFYNLMQEYRHAPLTDQKRVTEAYRAVIDYIEGYARQAVEKSRLDE